MTEDFSSIISINGVPVYIDSYLPKNEMLIEYHLEPKMYYHTIPKMKKNLSDIKSIVCNFGNKNEYFLFDKITNILKTKFNIY